MAAAGAAALLLLSCTGPGRTLRAPREAVTGLPPDFTIKEVPFFPQTDHHCGPAALATILVFNGVDTDPRLPTGRVEVRFDDGEPSYEIVCPSAYDAIEARLPAGNCRLMYHGSLALREARSRETLQGLRSRSNGTVFVDVNLRPPWWQREALQAMLHGAHWVKLNAHELTELQNVGPDAPSAAAAFLAAYDLHGLIVTHGSAGAEIWTADGGCISASPKGDIDVVDTVGAGDAFASVIILGIASDWPLNVTLQRAQLFASSLVGRRGATVRDRDFYRAFIDDWNLDRV